MNSITILCKHGLKITIQSDDLKNIPVLYQRYLDKLNHPKINLPVNFDYDIIIHAIDYYSTGILNKLDNDKSIALLQFATIYKCEKLQNVISEL